MFDSRKLSIGNFAFVLLSPKPTPSSPAAAAVPSSSTPNSADQQPPPQPSPPSSQLHRKRRRSPPSLSLSDAANEVEAEGQAVANKRLQMLGGNHSMASEVVASSSTCGDERLARYDQAIASASASAAGFISSPPQRPLSPVEANACDDTHTTPTSDNDNSNINNTYGCSCALVQSECNCLVLALGSARTPLSDVTRSARPTSPLSPSTASSSSTSPLPTSSLPLSPSSLSSSSSSPRSPTHSFTFASPPSLPLTSNEYVPSLPLLTTPVACPVSTALMNGCSGRPSSPPSSPPQAELLSLPTPKPLQCGPMITGNNAGMMSIPLTSGMSHPSLSYPLAALASMTLAGMPSSLSNMSMSMSYEYLQVAQQQAFLWASMMCPSSSLMSLPPHHTAQLSLPFGNASSAAAAMTTATMSSSSSMPTK